MAEDKKIKKCPVSLQPDIENLLQDLSPDDFASASRQEKDDFIQDRQSVSYWKDAWRRLKKNVVAMNIKNMNRSDADNLMEEILYDFPITKIYIETPKWFDFLECDHWMKSDLIEKVRRVLKGLSKIGEIRENILKLDAPYIKEVIVKEKQLENGFVSLLITMEDKYYYEILSDLAQADIKGEYDLISMLRDLSANRQQFEAIGSR